MRVARGSDVDVPVARSENARRDARRMIVASLRRDLAGDQPAHGLKIQHGDLALKQRSLHPLSLAGLLALEQSDEDADGTEQSGRQIGDRDADTHRSLTRQAGDRHQSAHPLRDLVDAWPLAVRSVLAKAGNTAIDDARIDRPQHLVVDAETMLDVRPVVLDHDIGGFGKAMENRLALRLLQVECDAALVAVQVLEVETMARAAEILRFVGIRRRLDLDDVGTPIGQMAHASGAGARPR